MEGNNNVMREALEEENARLLDENYQLRNELRIIKKKEEDIKYEYTIQEKFKWGWFIIGKVFVFLDETKELIKEQRAKYPNKEFRIIRRPVEWEVVE